MVGVMSSKFNDIDDAVKFDRFDSCERLSEE